MDRISKIASKTGGLHVTRIYPRIAKDHDPMPIEGSDKEKELVHIFLKFSKFLLLIKIKRRVMKGDPSRSP
jgi:hypothetical protein